MMEVPLPKDHEGREIPLDTLVLYDAKGGEMHVSSYRYQCDVMSCYFCGGSHIASIHSAPDRGGCNWSVGSMTLMRRYDGEPIVRVELDTSVMLDVSVNGSCGDCVSADVTADAYIEDIKYCPFCGEEL